VPVYEYECRSCDKRFETLTTMARADEAACPRCASTDTRKLLSVIAGLGGSAAPHLSSGLGGGGCGGPCSSGGSCACC